MIRTVRDERYRLIVHFYPELPYLGDKYAQKTLYRKEFKEYFKAGKNNELQRRFIAELKPALELYDIKADPYETKNLANSAEHESVLKRLRKELDNWMQTNNDLYIDYRQNGKALKRESKLKL